MGIGCRIRPLVINWACTCLIWRNDLHEPSKKSHRTIFLKTGTYPRSLKNITLRAALHFAVLVKTIYTKYLKFYTSFHFFIKKNQG